MQKRILFIIGSLQIGGAEQHLVNVAKHLKNRGWEPEVFTLELGGPLTSSLQAASIPVIGKRAPTWIKHVRNERLSALISLILSMSTLIYNLWFRKPSIVHFFLPAAYILGGLATFLGPSSYRIMSRRSLNNYQSKHRLFSKLERILHPKMDRVCGNSLAVIKQLEDEGIDKKCLRLIYNGVDLINFDKKDISIKKKSFNIRKDDFVIIIVANLIPYKGHIDLLTALSYIKNSLPSSWLLLCIGRDDGIGHDLKNESLKLGIAEHIKWMGSRTDVPDLLRIANIGVLCSHQEGFSNAVLEGMAARLPMVVTDVGGNAEAVLDGETGYVVPPRQPRALADAIMRLANDKERHSMGELGRVRVEDKFSLSACVDAYEALYRELNTT